MLQIGEKQGTGYRVQGLGQGLSAVRCPRSPEKGVTLVEVLLAVVVLAIGIVGVLRAYAACVATLEISRDTVTTIELLKEKMADIEQDIMEQGGISSQGSSGQFEAQDFAWDWKAQPTADENLSEITLTVSGSLDDSRPLSLITYVQNKSK